MNFKKWVKSIQTAGYNGARTAVLTINKDRFAFFISTVLDVLMKY